MDRRHHLSSLFLALLVLSVFARGAMAQATYPGIGEQAEFKTMLFAAGTQQSAEAKDNVAIAPDIPELFYFDGREYQAVSFSISGVSGPYRYGSLAQLRFYTRSLGAEGEWIYREVFNVQIQSDWTESIIILLPNYNGESKFSAFAVNTTPSDFAEGHIRVYNLSPTAVVLKAGEDVHPLAALEPVDIDISGIERNMLPVALALREDSDFKLVYRKRWSMRTTIRGIYFLFTLNEDYRRWYMRNIIL